jgi:hypothetical protein
MQGVEPGGMTMLVVGKITEEEETMEDTNITGITSITITTEEEMWTLAEGEHTNTTEEEMWTSAEGEDTTTTEEEMWTSAEGEDTNTTTEEGLTQVVEVDVADSEEVEETDHLPNLLSLITKRA